MILKDLNIKNSNNIDKILSKFEKVKIKMFSNPSLSKIDTLNLFYTFSTYLETNLGMSSIDTKQILEYMFNIYRLSGENDYQMIKVKFSDENKEMIKKYIKFIGVGVWDNKLDYQSKVRLISDIISLESGNYCNTMNSVNYSNLLGGLYDNYTDDKIDKIFTDLMFQTPFLYYDMLLSYTNYCLGYAREVNQNSANNKFFEFKYINLDGINPFFSSSKEKKEKIVNVFDENLFYQKQYEEENLYNNLKLISTKMKLLNTNNRTPNKSKIINSINQKIENIDVDYVLSVVSNRIEIEDISLNLSKDEILLILNELMEEYDNLSEQQSKVYNRFSETLSKYCKKGNKSYPISDLSLKLQNIDRELTEKKLSIKIHQTFLDI